MSEHLFSYSSDEEKWRAVQERDKNADGHFYYVVRTTGTYSKPSCAARAPRRENIAFFSEVRQARAAGYRPCRRCLPHQPGLTERYADAVISACRIMDESEPKPSLNEVASTLGFSRFHFHRIFKTLTGITPHDYLEARRAARVRRELMHADSVSDAIYSSGFSSNGRFYATAAETLGMMPASFRAGGRGALIHYVVASCWLGSVLVAVADRGLCATVFGRSPASLPRRLAEVFPEAGILPAEPGLAALMTTALRRAQLPALGRELLPVNLQTLALRHRLAQELRDLAAPPCDDWCDAMAAAPEGLPS